MYDRNINTIPSENPSQKDEIRSEKQDLQPWGSSSYGKATVFGRPIPDSLRCKALRRNCDCGYHFTRADDEKAGGRLMECPECGRPRLRCKKPSLRGAPTCRSHGGSGILKRAFIPTRINLDDEEIQALKAMIEKDDTGLKEEFHLLRLFFGKAILQFKLTLMLHEETGQGDLIDLADKLSGMLVKLSAIAEKREKIKQMLPASDRVISIKFDDPRLQYHIKEAIRDTQIKTIRSVLAALVHAVDPSGVADFVEKIPASFHPYLPRELQIASESEDIEQA